MGELLTSAVRLADFRIMCADMPVTVAFGGATMTGTAGMYGSRQLAQLAVVYTGYQRSVWIAVADCTGGVPAAGDLVTVAGTAFLVLGTSSDGVVCRLDLGAEYAG